MTAAAFTESIVEEATLAWLGQLGYEILHGPDIAPGEPAAERTDYRDPVLPGRLRDALARLNPTASADALDEAFRTITQVGEPSLIRANRAFHLLLVNGVEVDVLRDGEKRGELVRLIDFEAPENNDWLAVNQFTVEGHDERRPDVVIFVNGLPLAVVELKNAADEQATIWTAWKQFQTYQAQIPELLTYNEVLVVSDGLDARLGCLGTPQERFLAWKTIDGAELAGDNENLLEVLVKGVFEHSRFLDLIRSFVVFEQDPDSGRIDKKIAAYHQFHAVRKALAATLHASAPAGDRRGGVLWHTQGSGKSLTMLFFAGKLVGHPAMANPTIVMLTDRTDLDDQLHDNFAAGAHVLRQTPAKAETRARLRELLRTAGGGVIFTTIQKFLPEEKGDTFPELSARRNIVVMADEAHRSQYDFIDGYARHIRDALPNATFVGFTGTPLDLDDRDTQLIFGDYIDIYDFGRAIKDGATVPIHYESRLIKLDLPPGQENVLDQEFDELTEAEEVEGKEKLKTRWAQLEKLVGTEGRLAQIAADLVAHFERRQDALAGKAMIVCMSREICVRLYHEIVKLRPEWHSDDDAQGAIKVVMTGSASDPLDWQPHIRNKRRRRALADRFKQPSDPLQLVIVRDMWLTGFDVPPLHTIYVDKPMRGHALMQAIARVNRVFRDKPGGLVVDYLGLANRLKEALRVYADRGRSEPVQLDMNELIAVMLEQLDLCRALFDGFDYSYFLSGSPSEIMGVIRNGEQFIYLRDYNEPGILKRFLDASTALLRAYALASASDAAHQIRREVAFFQNVKASVRKKRAPSGARQDDLDLAVRQLLDDAIAPEGVVDIFAAAGLDKPDISILSEEFLAEVRDMPQRNLAVELLQKLLDDQIKSHERASLVQSRAFSERLKESLIRYHNRAIEAAQVIEALIELGRELRDAKDRGHQLGLTDDELAFYDALGVNDSAVKVLGDDTLRTIARELAETVRTNTTIDWTVRESVRANLRRLVRRVLRRHGYPPDKQDQATVTVIDQAELLSREQAA